MCFRTAQQALGELGELTTVFKKTILPPQHLRPRVMSPAHPGTQHSIHPKYTNTFVSKLYL